MKFIALPLLICLSFPANSQDTTHRIPVDKDRVFTRAVIESSYPGAVAGWQRYLMTNMHYPDEALKKEIQGQVIVQIIVEKDGTADSIIAISRPMEGGLREEAIRLIRQSGKWVPAIRDGINIRSQKRQPFVFKLG